MRTRVEIVKAAADWRPADDASAAAAVAAVAAAAVAAAKINCNLALRLGVSRPGGAVVRRRGRHRRHRRHRRRQYLRHVAATERVRRHRRLLPERRLGRQKLDDAILRRFF